MNTHLKIPGWIYACAAVVIVSGLMGFYAGIFNPGLFFGFMPNMDWEANQLPFLNGLWGTRNLSMIKLSEELVAKVGPTENGSTPRIWFSLLIDGLETNALPYSLSKKVEPAPVA